MDELLDNSPGGFLSFDDSGKIVLANATLCEWLGYEARALDGKQIDALLSMGGRIFYQTHLFPLLKLHGRADEIYFSLKRRDGSSLAVMTNAVRRERGGAFANDCVFLPMRQRREFEDELLEARKAADAASEAKAKFLSMMSHELRTPMNSILGFGQLLEIEPLDASQMECVEQILRAGRHLLELINEVLDISRIEAGQVTISAEPISAQNLMREAFAMTRPLAELAGITVRMELCPSEVAVLADPIRLRQLLLNLLSNAIKYNRINGEVRLACEGRAEASATVRFTVRDTGHGISAEKLGQLFQPFERLGAEAGEIEGTGLGLALSKRLVEAMGGAIGVESVEGEGSCFWIDLPAAEMPTLAPASTAPAPGVGGAADGEAVILYVEDDAANLHLVRKIMARRGGVRLLEATTGPAGLQLARTAVPDLILLDRQLPEMSGDELLAALRSDSGTSRIPIVILSADATPAQVARLLKAGADDYLTKPIDLAQFRRVIDELLARCAG